MATLLREEPAPRILKGGYVLKLRFKDARSTVDIDLTLQRVVAATSARGEQNQVLWETLQSVAGILEAIARTFPVGSGRPRSQ